MTRDPTDFGFKGFKQLCRGVPQNLVSDDKYPRIFQIM